MKDDFPTQAELLVQLERIAAAVGIPVACFLCDEPLPTEIAQKLELARLFDSLTSADARTAVLAYLRELAGSQPS